MISTSSFRQCMYCLTVGILSVGLLVGLWASDAVHQVQLQVSLLQWMNCMCEAEIDQWCASSWTPDIQ
jgi:hypothetical protein